MLPRKEMFETKAVLKLAALGVAVCCVLPLSGSAQQTRTVRINQQSPGWFGVRINDQMAVDEHGNAFFDSYPIVFAVDSGSPAAKAGLMPGDVLMTFNSHDMRGGAVELAKWLKVGAPFVLKIRRNDATKVLRGTLARRPDDWDQRLTMVLTVPEIMERQSGSLSRVPPERGVMKVRQGVPTPEPFSVLAPALGYGTAVYPFAGAEFTALNDDLCEALAVKRGVGGVFVTNVSEGSAARLSGLRGGDIIVAADGNKVNSPIDMVQAIKNAEDTDRGLVLRIMRKHRLQELTLTW